ncbi:ribbon-helix-helix domain-containing protein [uncultured Friedmanniella sp.]|uniref:ribbon-helix-helix domain-containing protein n=1 Tax=uncultured Friedmanniella sp. TaxID=335381 RepID=UPI0035CC1699
MRTTIRLPDDLYGQVRHRALETSTTVTSVIENALRAALAHPESPGQTFVVEPFAGNGTQPGIDLTGSAALLEAMEG